ncbi:phosphate ABC transporter permease PstA [Serpentinicella alkaliphila]|uniref:Phosphate transport system permease protein PstA n=1 Tax=Serpentinicella alkaliphila TaxID=1734049 RepID=A0A4V2T3T7_9FIRM|nr:phosphate ABC transporter permease PstA [Serpentinicella alkaliphila]QUH25320.1 phosphate ABC transporter permease PstA [Serpentinicella alkaliphila]TCQ02394.1 phosphate ABC transporter membrane protein 2 (PhoT family) [Serpentinicella alkaliphila]
MVNQNKKNIEQKLAFSILGLAMLLVIIPTVLIIGFIIYKGIGAISIEFITAMPRRGMTQGGIFPAIVGTLYLVSGTLAVALPLGIGSAIYLTEYAKKGKVLKIVRLAILNLAGVPSVVYGLFGLGLFVLFLQFGQSIIAGALTLACLILPVIITASEEALKSVPQSYREASLALGATKWQTVRSVVLPHAMPGILTGAILGIGRAAGETAPILLTVVAFFLPRLPKSVLDQVMALPYHLYIISTQIPNMPEEIKYGTALVLLGIVSIFFIIATVIRIKFKISKKA